MRKEYVIVMLALLLGLSGGCSDKSTEAKDDANAESYVLQDGVEVIDISGMLDDGTMRYELTESGFELWIRRSYVDNPTTAPFSVGDVLYCQPTQQVPYVVFQKVDVLTKTKRERDYYVVKTSQADLIDVFKECHIHRRIPLNLGAEDFELPDETVKLIETGDIALTKLDLTKAKLGVTCSGSTKADITINRGTVEVLDPGLRLDIDISNSILKQFRAVTQSRNKVDVDMSLDLQITQSCSFSKEIYRLKPPKVVTVQAGPIPIFITINFSVDIGASVGGAVTVNLTLDDYVADVTISSGLVYSNPSGEPCEPEASCYDRVLSQTINSYSAATEPLLEAQVQVSFELFARQNISAKVYDVAGPYLWFKQYVKPQGTMPSEDCDFNINQAHVEVVAGLDMGGGLKVEFANKTIASWEPHDFAPLEKVLWEDCIDLF
jgi:hypothetical protein